MKLLSGAMMFELGALLLIAPERLNNFGVAFALFCIAVAITCIAAIKEQALLHPSQHCFIR